MHVSVGARGQAWVRVRLCVRVCRWVCVCVCACVFVCACASSLSTVVTSLTLDDLTLDDRLLVSHSTLGKHQSPPGHPHTRTRTHTHSET